MVNTVPDLTTVKLEDALVRCRTAARNGYRIARDNLDKSASAIDEVSRSLNRCLHGIQHGNVRTPEIVDQLTAQLTQIVTELQQIQRTSNSNLKDRLQDLENFSIVLFGRTMAGKSTLMEILTRGDGRSIGTGAQRTTRDVRAYFWNGLKIIDVPGVAAFEGADDQAVALREASRADLVLFLITDDAPQPVEAQCLVSVLRHGKSVLGVCNVKVAVDGDDDLYIFLRDPARHFDPLRLSELVGQFHTFVDQHIPGKRIRFVETHLRARFLSNQPMHVHDHDRLIAASRFENVESLIVQEVVGRGSFLRVKSFVDGAVVPMIDVTDRFLEFSDQNLSGARVVCDKRQQFHDWVEQFRAHAVERIRTVVSQVASMLRDEVPAFVEDHFEDSSAGEHWNRLVQSAGIDRKVKQLQRELLQEFTSAASEVARELKSELSLVAKLSGDRQIKMDSIFDLRRALNWTTIALSGGLFIATTFATPFAGPILAAAVVVAVGGRYISTFFHSREEKAATARKNLTDSLVNNIDKIENGLKSDLTRWFDGELFHKHSGVLLDDLAGVSSSLFELADAQRKLAWALNRRQKKLNLALVNEALAYLHADSPGGQIIDVARLPGHGAMLKIGAKTTIDGRIRAGLETLLGEKIWLVVDTKSQTSLLAQAIGPICKRSEIKIQRKIRVAHVPLDKPGPVDHVRVQLAKQLTGLHVMQ